MDIVDLKHLVARFIRSLFKDYQEPNSASLSPCEECKELKALGNDCVKTINEQTKRISELEAEKSELLKRCEGCINPETMKPYFSGLDPNKFNKPL